MDKISNVISEVLISHEEIVAKCEELGQQISKDYAGKKPLLVGLLNGAVPFLAELIKHIDCDMEMNFMDVSSYSNTQSTGHVRIDKDLLVDITDRNLILVEDIIDTGLTLDSVIKTLKERKAASIETCTLVDKPEGRKVNTVNPKYIGFRIPKKFVVGFGLDYNELYRNFPYIGVLKEEVYSKKEE